MTIVRSGSTQKYAENWKIVFGSGNKKAVKAAPAKKKPVKKKQKSK